MIYVEIIIKSITTYLLMLILIKIIGKAGFAQLTPYDLTFVLIIAAVVIIIDGIVLEKNMAKTQFDMMQLLAALRLKGIRNISEVELGALEPNGEFSIIRKNNVREQNPVDSTYLNLKKETLELIKKDKI